ncbi:MAG: DUF456 domain-containing protein [Desulfovibrionales bacterium]
MEFVLASLFILLLVALLALHVFGLPANWVILGLIAIWRFLQPEANWGWGFVAVLLGLALIGEILEFFSQYFGARRYGGSSKGGWGALVGAIAGGILGMPFFFGIGALLGAMAGAYAGALVVERCCERTWAEARQAAWGAMWGKFFGLVAKLGIGIFMLALSIPRIWPG